MENHETPPACRCATDLHQLAHDMTVLVEVNKKRGFPLGGLAGTVAMHRQVIEMIEAGGETVREWDINPEEQERISAWITDVAGRYPDILRKYGGGPVTTNMKD